MIVNGRTLAEQRLAELKHERLACGDLTLAIVVMQEDAVTQSFLRIKNKMAAALDVHVQQCRTLAEAKDADGVILQLPLPEGIDPDRERNRIPPGKDVDVLSDAAYAQFVSGDFPPPPVPRAMEYILAAHQVDVRGKRVVVVGQGRLVGKPAAELFKKRGAHVTVLTRGDDIREHTVHADIIVLGAGEPHLLKPDVIRDGVVILDAGTSESNGAVVGDADPACAPKASLFTPVPGGIGPVAVVEIFANLFELARRS